MKRRPQHYKSFEWFYVIICTYAYALNSDNAMKNNNLSTALVSLFRRTPKYKNTTHSFEDFLSRYVYTDLETAVEEIHKRRQNIILQKTITEFLNNDIPTHFCGKKPLFYFSRHVATPNFETLKFIERTQHIDGFTTVIGEDINGKFASINRTKRALGKLPIVKGMNRMHDEIIENYTVVDFGKADGATFKSIILDNGRGLVETHHELLQEIYPNVLFVDESSWIDRHHRGNLLEQYKHLLALTLMHGVMFEIYYSNDRDFINNILIPAIHFVTKRFGCKPLICKLLPDENSQVEESDMVAYPSVVYPFIERMFKT